MNSQHKLEKILDITRLMMASADLDSLLQVVIDSALELLSAERASILLYDATRNELISRIAVGEGELRFSADCGIAGATIAARAVINVADAYADARFNPAIDKKTGYHTRNILSLPLFDFSGDLVGVLQVLNKWTGCFDGEDEHLATTLAAQAGVCLQHARLMVHYHEKVEMERAMEIARDIQIGLLPKCQPVIAGFDVAGVSEPADKTGGDLFDFIPLDDGCWLVIVADASGHGIGPALVVAETRAMLRAASTMYRDPCRLLATANRLLALDLDGRFVTCFVGLLDPAARTICYASAGHGPIIIYSQADDCFAEAPATGLPLGILAEADYAELVTQRFAPGDFVLIPTDGCFEMTDPDGVMYGTARLLEGARQRRTTTARAMLGALLADVSAFLQSAPRQDDCTAVLIKCL